MKTLSILLFSAVVGLRADPEYPKMGPDLYDRAADGTARIATAVAQAKAEHKNVLVELGANWCIWCRRLNATMDHNPDVAKELREDFVVVLVDGNHRHGKKRNDAVNDRYGNPMALGLPVLVVLNADGQQLTTQDSGALEDGKGAHDPAKIVAFLKKWAPPR